jgi:hypothetical protein
MGQSIFIVDPAYGDVNQFEDPSDAVIEEIEDTRDDFEVAEELLKLVGRNDDQQVIRRLLRTAYERDEERPALTTSELVQAVAAIRGLTAEYLAKGYLDDTYGQSPAQIELLRGRTPVLAYDKTIHGNQSSLLIQTLAKVATLEKVLQRAIDMKAHVALSD